jgi:hypothetical protein
MIEFCVLVTTCNINGEQFSMNPGMQLTQTRELKRSKADLRSGYQKNTLQQRPPTDIQSTYCPRQIRNKSTVVYTAP